MSRVNDSRNSRRIENQRRTEAYNKERAKRESQEFSKLMSQQQEATSKGTGRQQMAGGRHAGGQAKLMARQGISSSSFAQPLPQKGQLTRAQKQAVETERRVEQSDTRTDGEESSARSARARVGRQSDRLDAISGDDREGGRGSDPGGQEGSRDGQLGSSLGGMALAADQAEVHTTEAAAKAPPLPQRLLQEIVRRVMIGVNDEGLSEMQIELSADVLAGSWLKISAKDGKITAKFETGDANVRRLLEASEGQLARAFSAKGMSLERLEVQGP